MCGRRVQLVSIRRRELVEVGEEDEDGADSAVARAKRRSKKRAQPLRARQLRVSVLCFQAEDGIRDLTVTGVQTCALPISPPASRFAISVTGLSSRNRTNTGCRSNPSSVHSLYRTSAISAGSTQVCPASWGTGPEKAGVGGMPASSAALPSLSSASVNPLPTRPPYTSFPSWYAPRSSAPNPEREPLGRVKPTTTKSSVRSARILSQLGERPARYGASSFFATIPSSPIFTTCSYSASPSFSKCERYLSGPTRGTICSSRALRCSSGSGRRS